MATERESQGIGEMLPDAMARAALPQCTGRKDPSLSGEGVAGGCSLLVKNLPFILLHVTSKASLLEMSICIPTALFPEDPGVHPGTMDKQHSCLRHQVKGLARRQGLESVNAEVGERPGKSHSPVWVGAMGLPRKLTPSSCF